MAPGGADYSHVYKLTRPQLYRQSRGAGFALDSPCSILLVPLGITGNFQTLSQWSATLGLLCTIHLVLSTSALGASASLPLEDQFRPFLQASYIWLSVLLSPRWRSVTSLLWHREGRSWEVKAHCLTSSLGRQMLPSCREGGRLLSVFPDAESHTSQGHACPPQNSLCSGTA